MLKVFVNTGPGSVFTKISKSKFETQDLDLDFGPYSLTYLNVNFKPKTKAIWEIVIYDTYIDTISLNSEANTWD